MSTLTRRHPNQFEIVRVHLRAANEERLVIKGLGIRWEVLSKTVQPDNASPTTDSLLPSEGHGQNEESAPHEWHPHFDVVIHSLPEP